MKKQKAKFTIPNIYDILLAMIGVSLCGIGVGFANCAAFGLDSIGIFYDGIRNVLGFSTDMLGVASLIVSGVILVFLFFASRKYVSLGTLIYTIAYGSFVSVGMMIYNVIISTDTVIIRIIFSVTGYLLLYIGVGIYVAIDIGVDAFTGIVLYLADLTHIPMKYVKIVFDVILLIIGTIMGGTLGVASFVTMIVAGPLINLFSKTVQKIYFRFKLKKQKKPGNN